MKVKILTDRDVVRLVSVEAAAHALESAFLLLSEGRAALHTRTRTATSVGKLSTMGGVLGCESAVAGAKTYTTSPTGRFCFTFTLFDPVESEWLATLEAGALTRIRTAAVSLIAARRLARPGSTLLTVFGSGEQAEAHCLAFARAFPLREIRVVARRRVPDFVRRMERATDLTVGQHDDPSAAVDGSDLVVTATRSSTPLFPGASLTEGTHVTSVGATRPDAQELESAAVLRADRVVVESREQARAEAGNLIAAGVSWSDVAEIADLVAGRVSGRRKLGEITLFDSLGIGVADVAVAALAYRRAVENGVGLDLERTGNSW